MAILVTSVYGLDEMSLAHEYHFDTLEQAKEFVERDKESRLGTMTGRSGHKYIISEIIDEEVFAFSKKNSTDVNYEMVF